MVLTKGAARFGSGSAARVEQRASLPVKLTRRVRPGRYRLVVTGTDAHGRPVSANAFVTVRR